MVSVLFVTKVVLILNLFIVGIPLKKSANGHAFRVAKKRVSYSKRQYVYNPYVHSTQLNTLKSDRRIPYVRPFFYFKTNSQRRQSLPRTRGSYPYNRLVSNPYYYQDKIKSSWSNILQNTTNGDNEKVKNDHTRNNSPMPRKLSSVGVPLQIYSTHVIKTAPFLDNPSASGDETTNKVIDQGSFKIDDGPVKGFGTYQIREENVEVDVQIRIIPENCASKSCSSLAEGQSKTTAKKTASVGGSYLDEPPTSGDETISKVTDQGSFKIDDGPVKGFGMYQIRGRNVELDINIKVNEEWSGDGSGEKKTSVSPSSEGNTTTKKEETKPTTVPQKEEAFEQEALKAHNEYRARHDAPPMTLNEEMSKEAAQRAEEIGAHDEFKHSPSGKRENEGENIAAWCDAKGETATQVTKRWYDEVCDSSYDFSRNDMDWAAGHFTQVVWKNSKEMGIGFYDKKRQDGKVCRTIVALYREPGNGGGTFLENVKKGSFDNAKDCKKES